MNYRCPHCGRVADIANWINPHPLDLDQRSRCPACGLRVVLEEVEDE